MNRYFFECFVEQIYHFEALGKNIWAKLVPGEDVVFGLNDTYRNQVLVKFENKKLGVLSVEDSNKMLPFLQEDWLELFSGKICSVDGQNDENKRIKIVVYINNSKQKL